MSRRYPPEPILRPRYECPTCDNSMTLYAWDVSKEFRNHLCGTCLKSRYKDYRYAEKNKISQDQKIEA